MKPMLVGGRDIVKRRLVYSAAGALALSSVTVLVFAIFKHTFMFDIISVIVGFVIGYLVALAEEDSSA
jgi:xanthine/uracil permease